LREWKNLEDNARKASKVNGLPRPLPPEKQRSLWRAFFTVSPGALFGISLHPFFFKLPKVVEEAGLPGTKTIPAQSYFLSFLALKLIGAERHTHLTDHAFDPGLGLIAGLNVLPKCTAMSTYSYGLDALHLQQKLFVSFPRRAHYPILRNVAWHKMPQWRCLSWLNEAELELHFK
jgi:hypothetical protein